MRGKILTLALWLRMLKACRSKAAAFVAGSANSIRMLPEFNDQAPRIDFGSAEVQP